MEIFVFLLIGGIWAAFLLPAFFDNRRRAPISTTKNFARSQDLLALVSGANAAEVKARRHAAARRRQVMLILGAGAVASLALAVVQNSFSFLLLAIAFDLALAGYITLMLQLRASRVRAAPVVPLLRVEPAEDAQHHTVRVVAG